MSQYKDKKTGLWRYDFQYRGERWTGSGYKTKKAAATAERERKRLLQRSPTDITFGELCLEYLDSAKARNGGDWYKIKRWKMGKFLKKWKDRALETITQQDIEKHMIARSNSVSAGAANDDYQDIIRPIFNFAKNHKYIKESPCVGVKLMPMKDRKKKYIPPKEDVAKVFLMMPGHLRDAMVLMEHLLARSKEIWRLRIEDVDLDKKTVTLYTHKDRNGNLRTQVKPLNNTAREILFRHIKNAGKGQVYVIENPRTKSHYRDRHILLWYIRKYNKWAKEHGEPEIKEFGTHAFRHYSASKLKALNVPTIQIQHGLGHKNPSTTERYLQLLDYDISGIVEMLE